LASLAAELVQGQVNVIFCDNIAALAAKAATTSIPIVFAGGGDAVKEGLVSSLNRPGGNITGVNFFTGAIGTKRLELLRQIAPNGKKIGVLVQPSTPQTDAERKELEAAADALGQQLLVTQVNDAQEIERAITTLVERDAGALLVGSGPFLFSNLDVILAGGTEAALAAKRATSVIPIVFPSAGDPVGSGVVASLARPGGNVPGLSNFGSDLGSKRLALLREAFPALRRLAIMANADYSGGVTEMAEIEPAARTLGIEVVPLVIRRVEDIAPTIEALKDRAEALYVIGDPLMNTHRLRINTFALAGRLPTMHSQREYVEAAGLMSYGSNFPDLNRRAAEYVDKILRGAKPADLPVEQPTKFDLVVNLVTARALGVTMPPMLLARADEVIE